MTRRISLLAGAVLSLLVPFVPGESAAAGAKPLRFAVRFPASLDAGPLDGRLLQMFAPRMVARMQRTAPPGADLESWRY